jgi:hypothetical protein
LRGALQNQKLTDEVVEQGQADGGERCDQEHGGEVRRRGGEAAEVGDGERLLAVLQVADQDEERTRWRSAWQSIW